MTSIRLGFVVGALLSSPCILYGQTGTILTSGQSAQFSYPAQQSPTLFNGRDGYRIVVPPGATQLLVRVNDPTQVGSFLVFLRFASDVGLTSIGAPVFDHVSPSEGSDTSVRVSSDSTPVLRPGTYYIAVKMFNTGRGTGGITATVSSPCTYSVSPASVAVPATGASGNLTMTTDAACLWTATSDATWLTLSGATSRNGNGLISYAAAPNTAFTARSARITAGGQTITFSQAANAVPNILEVVDGGAFLPRIASAGWITIRGSALASTTRVWTGADFKGDTMPTTLDGTSVSVNGKPAAVYYVSPSQLNVLAPNDDSLGPVDLTVRTPQGTKSLPVTLQPLAPSFFMLDPDNRKYVAAVNLDGSLVGRIGLFAANPAATKPVVGGGRALLFGTGWGPTDPRQPIGQAFTDARPLVNAASVRITIGSAVARVEFAGAVSPGLYQFNIIAPDLPAGDYPIVGEINGSRTQTNGFITLAATPPPSISSISPSSGQGGTVIETLTITGQNLANVSSIVFSPSADLIATVLRATDTTITARLEFSLNAAAGQRNLTVRDGTRVSNALTFSVIAAPPLTISSISPSSGLPGAVIDTLTITGQNLANVNSLMFSTATGLTVSDIRATGTSVTARLEIATAASTGQRTLTVRDGARSSNSLPFTILVPPPTITSINPTSAQVSEIVIGLRVTGQNLGSSPQIAFDPSQGITVIGRGASGDLWLQFANDAIPGQRMVTATTSSGRSNEVPLTISPKSGNFSISNLRVSSPTGNGSFSVTVDFNDPSRAAAGGVNYVIHLPDLGFASTSATLQGVVSGQGSGTIRLDLSAGRNISRVGSVKVNLINSQGHRSNTLEGVF